MDLQDLQNLDTNKLMELQEQQLEKERRELAEKTRQISKRIDHIERAYRKEEIPVLAQHFEDSQKENKAAYAAQKEATLTEAKALHEKNLAAKTRLGRVSKEYFIFKKKLDAAREEAYKVLKAEADEKLAAAKKELAEKVLAEREAEKKRQAELAAKKAKEEQERKEREEREAKERQERQEREAEEQRWISLI